MTRRKKKPRIISDNDSGLTMQPKAETKRAEFNSFSFWNNLFTRINIGRYMSEQGADKCGENISSGIRFFLKAVGIGAFIALILWQLPNLAGALIQLINAIKA